MIKNLQFLQESLRFHRYNLDISNQIHWEGTIVAESNITKKALSSALKELIQEKPFEKISVADICQKCNLNRQSFYYHFKDKYDLVNWVFDTEFIAVAKTTEFADQWDFLEAVCSHFYVNQDFYRKVLAVAGQNSFAEHFRDFLHPVLERKIGELLGIEHVHDFYINFYSDALICTIIRWLSDRHSIAPKELIRLLKSLIHASAVAVSEETQ